MRVKVLAVLPGIFPSTIIDVITPLIDLNRAGVVNVKITVEAFVKKNDINWCDLIVLCRNIHPDTAWWFLYALELNRPYIYDIDDNFFEIPRGTPLAKYHREPTRQRMLKEYIRLANLVRVYSVPMQIRAEKINRNVEKVVAPIDWRLIMPPLRDTSEDIVRIVYATSRSEDKLSEIFKPALRRVLEKHSKGVQIHFLGYNPEEFRNYQNVFHHPMVIDYQNYLRSFSSAGYDIGLAPLLNDVFHRSKTNNKFREYGASQIAGIYSNVDVYSTCVEHKRTGILVENNSDAWFDAMEILIEDSAMRQNIQRQAFEFVKNNYSQEVFVNLWHQQIIRVLSRKDIKRRSTEKVENLIKKNSHSMIWNILTVVFNVAVNVFNVAVNVFNVAVNIVRGIRIRIINYMSMYRMLLKLRFELWLINHSRAKKM